MEHNFRLLSVALLLTSVCVGSNIQDSLVGVTHQTIQFSVPLRAETVYGSGICINRACSVIATANHVQMAAGRGDLAVIGGHTSKVSSLANESDSNKTEVSVGNRTFSYNIAKDVSFVYTKKPIRHKSGASFSYHYYVGQKVVVAGYCHGKFTVEAAHIIGADVLLEIGTAQLRDDLVLDIQLEPGQSGSAIIDERGQVIGMAIFTGAVKAKSGDVKASVALPIRTIAKALVKLDPHLGTSVFDDVAEQERVAVQATFEVDGVNDSPEDTSPVFLPELTAVASGVLDPVSRLRAKAAASASLLVNFIAKQCVMQGDDKPKCHEVAIIQGLQIYREMIGRKGKLGKPTTAFPKPEHGVWTEGEWLYTLIEIAGSSWVFQGVLKDQYLFSFMASTEDDRCTYQEYLVPPFPLFGRKHVTWDGPVACFEQILTDRDFNILSVFTDLRPPEKCKTQFFQTVLYFDSVKLKGMTSPVLLPNSERIVAKFQGERGLRYGNVSWTEYKRYRASHEISMIDATKSERAASAVTAPTALIQPISRCRVHRAECCAGALPLGSVHGTCTPSVKSLAIRECDREITASMQK
jgi:S1-C subfamily serine protease